MMIKFWQTMQKKEVIALLFKNFLLIVVVVQLLSHVQLFATPWTAAHQASLSYPVYRSLLRFTSSESMILSATLFILCLQSFPASWSFPMSWLFASGGKSIEASASVFPMNNQDRFPLELTGLISLQSKEFSRVFSSTTG